MKQIRGAEQERLVLEAAVKSILPAVNGAGGFEAGAATFVLEALEQPFFDRLRSPLKTGLRLLDELAQQQYGTGFAQCTSGARGQILSSVQRGDADTPDFPAQQFFELLIMLSIEGFLCDPRHGGNRDRLGWRHMGLARSHETTPCPLGEPRS